MGRASPSDDKTEAEASVFIQLFIELLFATILAQIFFMALPG